MKSRVHQAIRRSIVLAGIVAFSAACDGLLGTSDRRPNEARVVVTGTSPVPLRLITSTRFSAQPNIDTGMYDVTFNTFDSVDLPLPIDRTFRLDTDRFVVRLLHPDTETEATVRLEVFFDGRLAYSQEAVLVDSFVDFIQVFN
jgi:hypothetical protein